MLFNYIAFKRRNIEILLRIFQRFMRVGKTVKSLSLGRLISVPVIEEEVMQKSGTSTCSMIEIEKLAYLIVEIGNIQAMLKTGRCSVVGEILHLTHNAAFEKVGNERIVFAVLIFEVCLKTNGF